MEADKQNGQKSAGGKGRRGHWVRALLVAAAAAAVAGGAAALPESRLESLGGQLAPDGQISAALVMVLRRTLMLSGALAGALAAGLIVGWRQIRRGLQAVGRRLRQEGNWLADAARFHWRRLSRAEFIAMAILMACGVGIRLWYLEQPMRFDEATTVTLYASSPWYLGLANYSQPNNHLLNTLLVRMCMLAVGNREWVIRLPALLAGLLCLPVIYFYARLMYSRSAALLALAWLAVSLPFVDMATNARGYSMVACCGLISHICIYYILRRNYLWAAIFNALAIGLGLMAVPVAILYVGSGGVWAVLESRRLLRAGRLNRFAVLAYAVSVGAGGVIALAGYAPMLLALGPKWLFANQWVYPLDWSVFMQRLPLKLLAFARYNAQGFPRLVAALLLLGAAGYGLFWRRIEKTGISLPGILAGVCGLVLVLNRRFPLWGLSPMWMVLEAVLYAAVAAGFAYLIARLCGSRTAFVIALMAALAFSGTGAWKLVHANPVQTMSSAGVYILADIQPVARFLADRAAPGDEILTTSAHVVYQYYASRHGADQLNWSWDGRGRRRVFVLETPTPDLCYAQAMWHRLNEIGIMTTNDLAPAGEILGHRLWQAEVGP